MPDEYVNTRAIMGDQAAFDALIAGSLENLVEDGVTSIAPYAIYNNSGIKSVKFPNVTRIYQNGIDHCENLSVVDIGKECTFNNACLQSDPKLYSVILRGSTISTIDSVNSTPFNSTPIAFGYGGIYVPDNLLSTYKASTVWSSYNIYPISDYPRLSWETISDTWMEIFAAEGDGTYSNKYSIGDTKILTLNSQDYYAQIVAMDADELSDESGNNAKITWILKELYESKHAMNSSSSSNINGWPSTSIRSWLISDVLPLFPSDIRSNIKEVKKTYYDRTTSSTLTSNDSIWIPSAREILLTSSRGYENNGVSYTSFIKENNRRKALVTNGPTDSTEWWLRSTSNANSTSFQTVNMNGIGGNYAYSNREHGVCIGFCT